ncbi:hypothetical protein C5167_021565 [Papaver somniferum]|nr:hypothetical protein C5167_021565 [Papaver somniferum]
MESRSRHVVAMPYPGRGHINPMMNFCKLLTTKFSVKDDIRITSVVTEEWLGILESKSILPPQIQLRSIPNVIPSELVRGSDHKAVSVSTVRKAHCLLLTTYHELEPLAIKALIEVPVYPVGPSIPLSTMPGDDHDRTKSTGKMDKEEYYLEWLDSQPENSVLYVSFGSFLSASSEQMEEILAGLRESGIRYLLVSRGGNDHNNNEMGNSQSLVVPWSPHAYFPSSYGSNYSQQTDRDYWKIGMKVMKEVGALTVKKLMHKDDEES